MILKQLGANSTLLQYQDLSQKEVLFSYETPVAVNWLGSGITFVTEKKFSNTTNKHIKNFVNQSTNGLCKEVPQSWIEDHV